MRGDVRSYQVTSEVQGEAENNMGRENEPHGVAWGFRGYGAVASSWKTMDVWSHQAQEPGVCMDITESETALHST